MKKLIIPITLFLCLLMIAGTTTKKEPVIISFGAIIDSISKANYHKTEMAKSPTTYRLYALPPSVTIPTPTPGSQGSQGSCTAWGTTYCGRSADWAMVSGQTSFSQDKNIFSPKYIYNQIKLGSGCGGGSYITSALTLLRSQGVCTWKSMPYGGDCTTQPNTTQKAEAVRYKITSYKRVYPVNPTSLKTFLANGQVIITGGHVDNQFCYLKSGAILHAYIGPSRGGHCYAVVGYDDSKQAFKIMNSWGTGWASGGYGWIDYLYIDKWLDEAYVITTLGGGDDPYPVPRLSGQATTCMNVPVIYSTPYVVGDSYEWTATGGEVLSGRDSSTVIVKWGLQNSSISVKETIIKTGHSATASHTIAAYPSPSPLVKGTITAKVNQALVYSTVKIAGDRYYQWSVVGGIISGASNGSNCKVIWKTAGTGTVTVTETIGYGSIGLSCSNSSSLNVTIK